MHLAWAVALSVLALWAALETPSARVSSAWVKDWAAGSGWSRASRRRPASRTRRVPPDDDQRRRVAARHLESARTTRAPERRAQAFFRAGEQLRAAGEAASAARAFRGAAATGRIPWACRALLELAHLERRAGRFGPALEAYESLIEHSDVSATLRDVARSWSARTLEAMGRLAQAERLWKNLAQLAQRPLQRVRAYDRLASLCLARGDLEAAREVLEQCDASLAALAAQHTPQGDTLRAALARMSSRTHPRARPQTHPPTHPPTHPQTHPQPHPQEYPQEYPQTHPQPPETPKPTTDVASGEH